MAHPISEEIETHESWGMLGFTRVSSSGSGTAMHGSDLKHNTFIEMNLYHGSKRRGLSHNWYHADDRIATVRMSRNQFSELITTMNVGDGIPVTVSYTEKDGRMKEPDFESVNTLYKDEYNKQQLESIKEARELVKTVKELLAGSGTVTKVKRETIIDAVEKIERDLGSNAKYRKECFHEAMDNIVTDAKSTIEAYYEHRVIEAGLDALQNPSPKLIDSE